MNNVCKQICFWFYCSFFLQQYTFATLKLLQGKFMGKLRFQSLKTFITNLLQNLTSFISEFLAIVLSHFKAHIMNLYCPAKHCFYSIWASWSIPALDLTSQYNWRDCVKEAYCEMKVKNKQALYGMSSGGRIRNISAGHSPPCVCPHL